VLVVFAAFELLLVAVAIVGGLFLYVARAGAPSSAPRPNQLVWGAALAPLLITFASTQFAYSTDRVPWISPVAYVGMAVGVLLGVGVFSLVSFRSWPARFFATCGYVALSTAMCVVVGVFTASANGDSL
jgi:ABC-type transport system involved in cytochrome c biogenesis permease subunit